MSQNLLGTPCIEEVPEQRFRESDVGYSPGMISTGIIVHDDKWNSTRLTSLSGPSGTRGGGSRMMNSSKFRWTLILAQLQLCCINASASRRTSVVNYAFISGGR